MKSKLIGCIVFAISAFMSPVIIACDTAACSVAILPTDNQVTAISNGAWNTAATWSTGVVPGSSKNVIIPQGLSVTYNRNSGIASVPMRSVLVQGTLSFSTTVNTGFVVDTLVVDSTGVLNIGTSASGIAPNRIAKVVFAGGDLSALTDPQLKGRGLLNHGAVNVYGSQKTPYVAAAGIGSVTGSSVNLKSIPAGWLVGDSVLITGSDYEALPAQTTQVTSAQYETHDEVRTIAAISGYTVTFNSALGSLRSDGSVNKHERVHPGMDIYVANLTRNVQLSTAAANVSNISRRGHSMFMGSPNVSINNASFVDMGRSDKSYPLTAKFANGVVPGSNPVVTTAGSTTQFNSNMRGRYPAHFHKIGEAQSIPVTFSGNVILRSPGWGVSLHSSHGNISNNVSYDVFGSHFVSEDGDERGHIDHNLAVKSIGDTVEDCQYKAVGGACEPLARKQSKGFKAYDVTVDGSGNPLSYAAIQDDGQVGNCYWLQSRNLEVTDNLANSCSKSGFMFFHRHVVAIDIPYADLTTPHRDIIAWHKKISNTLPIVFARDEVPLVSVVNNKTTASHTGLDVIKAENNQQHNVFNHIVGTRSYNVARGMGLGYTGKYLVEDTEVYAMAGFTGQYEIGIETNNLVENLTMKGFTISGWDYPMDSAIWFEATKRPSAITFIDGHIQNAGNPVLTDFDPALHLFEFDTYPRVSSYLPDIHKVVALNTNMTEGSGFIPEITDVDMPVLDVGVTGWWNQEYKWTATLTDSAGVAPFSLPTSDYSVNSLESKWLGQAVRARWMEKVGTTYVNRVLEPDGSTCLILNDHIMDRVNRQLVEAEVCIPVVGF